MAGGLLGLGLGGNIMAQAEEQQQKQQLARILLAREQAKQRGTDLAGKLFPGMAGGANGLPGATTLPWAGGGTPSASPLGLPNGGAPPVPNAGGAMQPSIGGMVSAPPPTTPPAATNGLSWQQLAMAIKKQAPEADGATIMQVVEQYAPMMNQQSKMDVALMQMMVRDSIAQMKDATTQRGQDISLERVDKQQEGANNRAGKKAVKTPEIRKDPTWIKLNTRLNTARVKGDPKEMDKAQADLDAFADSWVSKSGKPSKTSVGQGTEDSPIVPAIQADIDDAPAGTVFLIDGQKMTK